MCSKRCGAVSCHGVTLLHAACLKWQAEVYSSSLLHLPLSLSASGSIPPARRAAQRPVLPPQRPGAAPVRLCGLCGPGRPAALAALPAGVQLPPRALPQEQEGAHAGGGRPAPTGEPVRAGAGGRGGGRGGGGRAERSCAVKLRRGRKVEGCGCGDGTACQGGDGATSTLDNGHVNSQVSQVSLWTKGTWCLQMAAVLLADEGLWDRSGTKCAACLKKVGLRAFRQILPGAQCNSLAMLKIRAGTLLRGSLFQRMSNFDDAIVLMQYFWPSMHIKHYAKYYSSTFFFFLSLTYA